MKIAGGLAVVLWQSSMFMLTFLGWRPYSYGSKGTSSSIRVPLHIAWQLVPNPTLVVEAMASEC